MRSLLRIPSAILLVCVGVWLQGCGGETPASKTANDNVLTIGSWGGAYQEAQRKAFFEPFTKETGIKIVETSTPDYGKFYEWQKGGTTSVDVVDVETYFVFQAGRKGALRHLPKDLSAGKQLMTGGVNEYGLASCAYADVIAWNSGRHPDWRGLTWADFWNTAQFKGARGLRDLPASTLEAALLAKGTPSSRLYPLDVEGAFAGLSDLRKRERIALWGSGSQPIEWLLNGSVELSSAWNGRVYDAQKEGKQIAMTFDGGMLDWLWWVIPVNSSHSATAERFIEFTLRPDRQAELAKLIPYGPANQDALKLLDDGIVSHLPTSPAILPKLIQRDNNWWAEHDEQVQPRWREWKVGLGR